MSQQLTVILPAYNASKTIGLALWSVLNQSFRDFKVIVIDDGSADNTADIIRLFKDPRIHLVSDGQNKGLPSRLNQGIDMSDTPFIARMDADDFCFPDRFQKQIDFLICNPKVDLLGANALSFDGETGNPIGLFSISAAHKEITMKPWGTITIPHPTWMMRLDWAKRFKYKNFSRGQDQELLCRAYKTSIYACLPDVLLAYAVSPFHLKKTLLTRWALLAAKTKIFIKNKTYSFIIRLFISTAFKTSIDVLSVTHLFSFVHRQKYARQKIPAAILNQYYLLLDQYHHAENSSHI